MFNYACLNPIAGVGLDLFSDNYQNRLYGDFIIEGASLNLVDLVLAATAATAEATVFGGTLAVACSLVSVQQAPHRQSAISFDPLAGWSILPFIRWSLTNSVSLTSFLTNSIL